jgi:hypothetical protein
LAVIYRRFDGARVSRPWYRLLADLRVSGATFHLNSGHRTMREQWGLFRQNMHLVRGRWAPRRGRSLTAFPSPLAPHVRIGRRDHACDFDGAAGVEVAAKRKGVSLTLTVPGEPWHLEANARELFAYHRRRTRQIRRARRRHRLLRAKAKR